MRSERSSIRSSASLASACEELALLRVLGLGDELASVALGLNGVEQLPGHLGPAPHARVLLGDLGVVPLVVEDVRVREFFR